MPLRLLETVIPDEQVDRLKRLLESWPTIGEWYDALAGEKVEVRILAPAEHAEGLLDLLEQNFSMYEDFRVIVLPVQASVPRPEAKSDTVLHKEESVGPGTDRIGREELYQEVSHEARLTRVFVAFVALSAIVAGIGLVWNNVAVVIGAMVIAPLLGPNMALALGTTLGDLRLAKRALFTNAVGISVAFAVSLVFGAALEIDPAIPEIASRCEVGLGSIALALASGCAGALAFTGGMTTTVVGVMVAVALLPPLMASGMLLASGDPRRGVASLLLFLVNLICVNLSGVLTFRVQGIGPSTWRRADQAKRAARAAVAVWVVLLAALATIIVLARGWLA